MKKSNHVTPFTNPSIGMKICNASQSPDLPPVPSTETRYKVIHVDSRDRNRITYPSQCNFMIEPTIQKIKNIQHIHLKQCILPDFTNTHPYLILVIPELQNLHEGTNNLLRSSFGVLVPENINGSFVTCRFDTSPETCGKISYYPSLADFPSKITIQIYDPDGTIHDFGGDTDADQVYIMFEICHLIKDTSIINSQIVI